MQEDQLGITILIKVAGKLKDQKKRVDVPIEREKVIKPETWMPDPKSLFNEGKVPETGPRMKKQRKESTGIAVTISDDPFPVVTHIQALSSKELPNAYLESYLPKVWLSGDRLLWGPDLILLQKEVPYSRSEISGALLHIRLAGEHLAAINKPERTNLKYCQAATFKDGKLKSST